MSAYTVEIQETNVVFVPKAASAADAEQQAVAWIEAHATGAVRVSGAARPVGRDRACDERLLADTEITEG